MKGVTTFRGQVQKFARTLPREHRNTPWDEKVNRLDCAINKAIVFIIVINVVILGFMWSAK